MKKIMIVAVIAVCMGFSYGVRPAFDFNVGYAYLKMEGYDGLHMLSPGFMATAPFCRYIGLEAELFSIGFALNETATTVGLFGGFGLIEMIPTKYVSPFFTQQLLLNHLTVESFSETDLGFSAGAGLEFISASNVSPFIGGRFAYIHYAAEGYSTYQLGINAYLGVRFSWVK